MLPCDDLIGVINLPLNLLDLSQESGKLYTCLIGHDSKDEKVTKDTARMNLKISAQSAEIFNLKLEMVSICILKSKRFKKALAEYYFKDLRWNLVKLL